MRHASKTRSTSAEIAHKNSSSTIKSSNKMAAGSPDTESKSRHGRNSADKSPRPSDRKASKISSTSNTTTKNNEKKMVISKDLELQQQLVQAQMDLKKSMDQLEIAEDAKSRALEEAREMKKMAEEANLRLAQVMEAQNHMEKISVTDKYGIDESNRARPEAAKKRDQICQLQFEALQKQQSLDAAELLATKEELKRVKKELSLWLEERDLASNLAEDSRKVRDMNAKKVEDLSAELTVLRDSLDFVTSSLTAEEREKEMIASKWEAEARESALLAAQSNLITESLRKEIARTQDVEMQLAECETLLGKLKTELCDARDSESVATNLLMESKERIELLEKDIVLAKESEGKALTLIISLTRQLEETKLSLEEAMLEISSLKQKTEAMESSVRQTNNDMEASHLCLERAKLDLHNMTETVETLRSELNLKNNDLLHSQERESLAISNMQALAEEASGLRNELRLALEAEEKSKKALDDLAMVLREVTKEANDTEAELESAQLKLQKIKSEGKAYGLKIEGTEDDEQLEFQEARKEIACLKEVVERARLDGDDLTSAWKEKEIGLINCIKISEQEVVTRKEENAKLMLSLQDAEERVKKAEEENQKLMDTLEQVETESTVAREAFELLNMENLRLRESFSDIHKELESAIQENKSLKGREEESVEKTGHLMRMLDGTSAVKFNEKTVVLEKANHAVPDDKKRSPGNNASERMKSSGKANSVLLNCHPLGKSTADSTTMNLCVDPVIVNSSLYASAELHDLEKQYEPIDPISDVKPTSPCKTDGGDTLDWEDCDHIDGPQMEELDRNNISPSRQTKKKALLRRFGDLLKKKSNHK